MLTEINIPESDNPKYIMGRNQENSAWLIYNIDENKIIFSNQEKKLTVQEWKNLGNSNVKLVKVGSLDKYFQETDKSKSNYEEHAEFARFIGQTFLIAISIPLIIDAYYFSVMNKFYFRLGVGAEGLGVNAPKPRLLICFSPLKKDIHGACHLSLPIHLSNACHPLHSLCS